MDFQAIFIIGVLAICFFLSRILTSIKKMGFTLDVWSEARDKPMRSRDIGLAETLKEMGFTRDTWRDSDNNLQSRDRGLAETTEDIKKILGDISKRLAEIEDNTAK